MQAQCKPSDGYLGSGLGFPEMVGVAVTLLVTDDYVIGYLLLISIIYGMHLSACHLEFHLIIRYSF